MRGVINIVIGLVFIVGGLTGKLSMRGPTAVVPWRRSASSWSAWADTA
jgi:hypothetical protein